MAAGRYAALIVAWKLLGHKMPARFEDYFEKFKYTVLYENSK